jgi:integrase
VELANPHRPHPVVWTDRRVAEWRQTGERPAVAVWTARQAAQFLDHVAEDRLFAVWWLIALRGLRRGEAAGLRWADVDLDHRQITIAQQLTMCGRTLVVSPPKSAASRRTIALDRRTVEVLRAHGRRRHAMRIAAGSRWTETGYVFTRPNGLPLQPDYLTQRFHLLVERHGLPPVRLHDLRHGAASLAHSAGADLKTVQDQLGHASIVLTADTYTSVLPPQQYRAADATARLILTAVRAVRGKMRRHPTSLDIRPGGTEEHRPGPRPIQPVGPGQGNHKKRSKRIKKVQKRARRAMAKAQHHRGNH